MVYINKLKPVCGVLFIYFFFLPNFSILFFYFLAISLFVIIKRRTIKYRYLIGRKKKNKYHFTLTSSPDF